MTRSHKGSDISPPADDPTKMVSATKKSPAAKRSILQEREEEEDVEMPDAEAREEVGTGMVRGFELAGFSKRRLSAGSVLECGFAFKAF